MIVIGERDIERNTELVAGIGFFDGVHLGHRSLIDRIVTTGRELNLSSAVITFSNHPREVLSENQCPLLLTTYEERMEKLAETGLDYCISLPFTKELSEFSARKFLDLLASHYGVRCLYVGYDHRFGHDRNEGFDAYKAYGKELGISVVKAEPYEPDGMHVSSSVIRRLLEEGNINQANRLLSYPYGLWGKVVEGYRIGRKIGFPTANIVPLNAHKIIPASGVYAVKVKIGDTLYGGMLNIGTRPTVHPDAPRNIEVHIFGYSGNLYGENIGILFLAFLRPERKMSDISELSLQLEKDREQAKALLSSDRFC